MPMPEGGARPAPAWPQGASGLARRIREHGWDATPLGGSEGWPQSLRTVVEMMLGAPHLATLAVGPQRIFLYNDEAAGHYGDRHPGALGQPLPAVFADEFARVAPVYDRVFAGESLCIAAQPLDPGRTGTPELFDAYLSPVRDAGGRVVAAYMTGFAVGERLRAEARLRESEEAAQSRAAELEAVLESLNDAIYIGNAGGIRLVNRPALDQLGYASPAELDRAIATLGSEIDDRDAETGAKLTPQDTPFARALAGEKVVREVLLRHRQTGEDRIVRCSASPVRLAGRVIAAVAVNTDVTEQKRAAARLRESEERQAFLLRLSDTLRPLADPAGIQRSAAQLLGERLGADRAAYGELEAGGEFMTVAHDWSRPGTPSTAGRFRMDDFGAFFTAPLRSGRVTKIEDAATDPRVAPALYPRTWGAIGVRSAVACPLVKAGRLSAALFLHSAAPRAWTEAEEALVGEVAERTWEAVERARVEAALRAGGERRRFLLDLSDRMSAEAGADAVVATASRMLGEHLKASRVVFAEIREEAGVAEIRRAWAAEGAEPHPAVLRLSDFGGPLLEDLRAGRTVRFDDTGDPSSGRGDLAALAAIGIGAGLSVPLLRGGRFVVNLNVHQSRPRAWTDAEAMLVQDVASRIWDAVVRARAEEALRESEERLRQFGEASSDVLWIRNADTLQWEYLTPAFEAIYGLPRAEALAGDDFRNWADLIVPEDREAVLQTIRGVASGERATFEYRIRRPSDGAVRWLRNTDFPMRNGSGRVVHVGGVGHDVTPLKQAEEHQKLLLLELQHRVRNTLAVIRSIIRRTAQAESDVETYVMHVEGRIDAFARVQATVTRDPARGIDLGYLVAEELRAAGAREGETAEIEGPQVLLTPKAAETLALGIHELATNAMKYGALTVPRGTIAVAWNEVEEDGARRLDLRWTETGMHLAGPPRHRGFGTMILTRTLGYELAAKADLAFPPPGLAYRIRIPLDHLLMHPMPTPR